MVTSEAYRVLYTAFSVTAAAVSAGAAFAAGAWVAAGGGGTAAGSQSEDHGQGQRGGEQSFHGFHCDHSFHFHCLSWIREAPDGAPAGAGDAGRFFQTAVVRIWQAAHKMAGAILQDEK